MHISIRIFLLILAGVLYVSVIGRSATMFSAIGLILLMALLLMGMESVKRKKDKNFTIQSEMTQVSEMDRDKLILYTAQLFKRLGYYISPIPKDKDKGADLIIRKGTQVICVRCEAGAQEDILPIQKIYGSMRCYKAKKCLLVTTGYISEDVKDYAKCNHVQMIDRDHLLTMIRQVVKKEQEESEDLETQGV